jgi:hypothetical protein
VYTAEERRQMRRDLYLSNEAVRERRREQQRKYYRTHSEAINQKQREARMRAKLSPQLLAAQRWLKWRERQKELEQEQTRAQGRSRAQGKSRTPAITPALTAEDSARNWLAYRERQKEADLSQSAAQRRTQERALGKSIDDDDDELFDRRKEKVRNRDYDYGR